MLGILTGRFYFFQSFTPLNKVVDKIDSYKLIVASGLNKAIVSNINLTGFTTRKNYSVKRGKNLLTDFFLI